MQILSRFFFEINIRNIDNNIYYKGKQLCKILKDSELESTLFKDTFNPTAKISIISHICKKFPIFNINLTYNIRI